jgi:antitoxin Phd
MHATATEVKNRFGEFMDKAQREPVTVEKTGRSYVVLISHDEYERLQGIEDSYWAEKADNAKKSGYLGTAESMAFLSQDRDDS